MAHPNHRPVPTAILMTGDLVAISLAEAWEYLTKHTMTAGRSAKDFVELTVAKDDGELRFALAAAVIVSRVTGLMADELAKALAQRPSFRASVAAAAQAILDRAAAQGRPPDGGRTLE